MHLGTSCHSQSHDLCDCADIFMVNSQTRGQNEDALQNCIGPWQTGAAIRIDIRFQPVTTGIKIATSQHVFSSQDCHHFVT